MTTKTVYGFDPESRVYTGPITLDKGDVCPRTQTWLIPGNCLDVVPPKPPQGRFIAEKNGKWVSLPIPTPPPEVAPPAAATVLPDPLPPTRDQVVAAMAVHVQKYLDGWAATYGYSEGIAAAVSYAEEPSVPKFQQDGRALRELRSRAWAQFYGSVANGETPTETEILNALPRPMAPEQYSEENIAARAQSAVLMAEAAKAAEAKKASK